MIDKYVNSKKIIGSKYLDILEFVGLKKNDRSVLRVRKEPHDSKRVEQLLFERDELVGLLEYLSRLVFDLPPTRKRTTIIEFLKEQQHAETIITTIEEEDSNE